MDAAASQKEPTRTAEAVHKREKDDSACDGKIVPELKDEYLFRCQVSEKYINLWLWSFNKRVEVDNTCDRLLAIIKPAKNTETVDIGADMWNHLSTEEITKVLHAVGNLPKLKWLHFSLGGSSHSERSNRHTLSINNLSFIASKAKKLQYFVLKDVKLEGTKTDWLAFTAALKSHTSLVHLRLESYSFAEDAIDLGDLVTSLSHVATLEMIEIFATPASCTLQGCHLPPTALACLIRESKTLQVVRFSGLDIGDEHLSDIVEPLSNSKTMTELLLWEARITENGSSSLAKALKVNKSIKRLNLNDNDLLGPRGCQILFESIPQSLQELYVGCSHMDSMCRDALLQLVDSNTGLKDGTRLKKLEVCFSWPLDTSVESMANFGVRLGKSLRDNKQVLEYLRFYHTSNHDAIQTGTDLDWGSSWEKRSRDDDDDEDC
jgi:Ran GTPase-activating protein (RanGAP) involved in mRNA processing and transport